MGMFARLLGKRVDAGDTPDQVKCSLQKVKEDHYPLAGSIEILPFELLVQALSAAWKSGVLLADCEGQIGKVYFEQGLIVSVQLGSLRSQEAFNQIYRQIRGHFLFQSGKQPPQKEMEGSVLQHLLTAARSVDESAAVGLHSYVDAVPEEGRATTRALLKDPSSGMIRIPPAAGSAI